MDQPLRPLLDQLLDRFYEAAKDCKDFDMLAGAAALKAARLNGTYRASHLEGARLFFAQWVADQG